MTHKRKKPWKKRRKTRHKVRFGLKKNGRFGASWNQPTADASCLRQQKHAGTVGKWVAIAKSRQLFEHVHGKQIICSLGTRLSVMGICSGVQRCLQIGMRSKSYRFSQCVVCVFTNEDMRFQNLPCDQSINLFHCPNEMQLKEAQGPGMEAWLSMNATVHGVAARRMSLQKVR